MVDTCIKKINSKNCIHFVQANKSASSYGVQKPEQHQVFFKIQCKKKIYASFVLGYHFQPKKVLPKRPQSSPIFTSQSHCAGKPSPTKKTIRIQSGKQGVAGDNVVGKAS